MLKKFLAPKRSAKSKVPIFRVLRLFAPFKWRIIGLLLVGTIAVIGFALTPMFLRSVFDHMQDLIDDGSLFTGEQMMFIYRQLAIFGILMLLNEGFTIFCMHFIPKYEDIIMREKVVAIKKKLDTVPVSFFDNYTTGDLSRRVSEVTTSIIRNKLVVLFRIVRTVFFCITTAIVMFSINWILALVVLTSMPICIIAARVVSKRTQKYFKNHNVIASNAFRFVDQQVSLHDFYRTHGIDDAEQKYQDMNEKHTSAMIGENVSIALNTIYITFIQNFMSLLVTVVFGILFVNQTLPYFGALPAFLFFGNRFLAQSVVVTESTNLLQGTNARSGYVFDILDFPDDVTEREIRDVTALGNIEFKNVSYEHGGNMLIDDVSFSIPRGSSLAIVGPVGNGKRQVVELLSKLDLPTDGSITVDGTDIREIKSQSFYKRMGIAFEKPFIFKGTVAENLLYGITRTLPENVMNVTMRLNVHEFIEQLPNRYETMLSSSTSSLSRSQKQSINVCRTVLQSPDLVIFSEAMSASDTVTEKETYEKIMTMDKKQTTIFVTHRLSSVEKCDHIIYMDKGKIVEQGTHAQLMRQKGRYFEAFMNN